MTPLLGYKLGMTRVFNEAGRSIPVTALKVDECFVTAVKTVEKDGYAAVQIGTGKKRHPNKPLAGQFKALPAVPQHVREFRVETDGFEIGQELTVEKLSIGDRLKLTGTSKGKGFQGVIKRHNFRRGPETHGSDHHRAPGSIGSMFPQHVMKNHGMPGHMGHEQVSVRKVEVVDIFPNDNIVLVKGPVPGIRGALVEICPM